MSAHHDSGESDGHHGGGGHGGNAGMEWMDKHMSGIIMPLGQGAEKLFEKFLFLIMNGFWQRIASIYMIIFTPVILIEFVMHFVRL